MLSRQDGQGHRALPLLATALLGAACSRGRGTSDAAAARGGAGGPAAPAAEASGGAGPERGERRGDGEPAGEAVGGRLEPPPLRRAVAEGCDSTGPSHRVFEPRLHAGDLAVAWAGDRFVVARAEQRDEEWSLVVRALLPGKPELDTGERVVARFDCPFPPSIALASSAAGVDVFWNALVEPGNTELFFANLPPDGAPAGPPQRVTRSQGLTGFQSAVADAEGRAVAWSGTQFGIAFADLPDYGAREKGVALAVYECAADR